MITAQDYYNRIQNAPIISSGDPTIDQLLHGGFIQGPVHFLFGPSAFLSAILMKTAVNAQLARVDGGAECQQVAYIDGENTFNPYYLSKYALSKQAAPQYILDRILVARTFTWNQMVEVVEEKLAQLTNVDLILISGMTSMFEETVTNPSTPAMFRGSWTRDDGKGGSEHHGNQGKADSVSKSAAMNWSPFQDLNRMIGGLKRIIEKCDPTIVMTGPFNSRSRTRPTGGQILTHFGGVLIGIEDQNASWNILSISIPICPFKKSGCGGRSRLGITAAHIILSPEILRTSHWMLFSKPEQLKLN